MADYYKRCPDCNGKGLAPADDIPLGTYCPTCATRGLVPLPPSVPVIEDFDAAVEAMLEADLADYGDYLFEMTAGEEGEFVERRREKMARLLAAAVGKEET